MFNRNRDRVLSIGIQSLGYNPKSNHRIEKRVDALEQRMSKAEVAVEQLRQLVLEQQSRPPPVTVEQIRELILEQRDRCNRRRGRPRERDHHYDEEEEWTDNSTWSWDSQSQPQQTDGGNDQSFCDVEEGIHLNKLEFQPETELKVCETAVKVVTEKMRVLCTTEENDCAPTPALQSRTPPLNVVRSTMTLVRQVAPPKPPVSKNFQIIEAPVAHTQLLEPDPSDSNQSVMVLPQRVPLPKPPDPENYVQGNGSLAKLPPSSQSLTTDSGAEISPPPQATPAKMTSRSTEQIDLTSVEKNLERRRAKKVISILGGILEKLGAKWGICEFGTSFNLMNQTHINEVLLFEIFTNWAGAKIIELAQFKTNNLWVQKKGNSHIPIQGIEERLLYLPCGLGSLLIVIRDVKVLDVLRMSTYVISQWQYKDVKALEVLQMLTYAIAKWAFTCEYAWHAGKKIGVHIFIPNHYVGTLKDINVTKELSRPVVVSMGVGNSNLIRIDCWLKQHNNKVILSTCDAIQSGAIKQLWALAIIFQTYVLKKGHAKDLVGVAKEACQQASHNGLDVVLVDIAERRHDYEYFICDNMLEFNSSLKDMDKIGGQPMLVKKLLNPTMDSKNRENGIALAAIVFHLTIFSIKDAVCDFIMLLDFVEETPLDILNTDKYSGPSDVKKLKLKMMTAVANESNTGEMVTEQREYDANADIPIARKSIWVVVKMVLQQYDVKCESLLNSGESATALWGFLVAMIVLIKWTRVENGSR
ncbi:unnamed protein product [Trifolium pratense]|uniref:Uncharacterized protein n=1 Tax=Trifolium pratense TaxID=57577 RepID=A0ACB0JCT8_TRIPR|nr:unnamed protein product [Trifolium pratense]